MSFDHAAYEPCPPALTGGESLRTFAKVDWLTVTWWPEPDEHVGALVRDCLGEFLGGVQGVSVPGMFGYESGVRYFIDVDGSPVHVARVDYGGSHHKGRARLDMSGTGCGRVTSWAGLQDWCSRLVDYTLTRVDLAVDCLEGEFTVEHAKDWYLAGQFNAGGRMPRHSLVGDWLAPKHGRTLEVGRRENGKMLRAYEKGRQLGDQDSQWTRFEVELRNIDRDLPLDILTECDKYFVGAYRCLETIVASAAERIPTHKKEGSIVIERLTTFAKSAYGRLFSVLRATLSADEVIEAISRPGIPGRLEKASLLAFQTTATPAAYLKETKP